MKKLYLYSIGFWFVLLVLALTNATLRETTYKPLLTPVIGMWAHQISSVTAILLFFGAISWFVRKQAIRPTRQELVIVGLIWLLLTFVFETLMNVFVRHLNLVEVLQTYYFWQGETWIFVLLSLLISPQLVYSLGQDKR